MNRRRLSEARLRKTEDASPKRPAVPSSELPAARESRTVSRRQEGRHVAIASCLGLLFLAFPFNNLRAQDSKKTSTKSAAKAESARPQVSDLNTRYRLIEQYVVENEKAKPGELGQYRVASRDSRKTTEEKPQGAPDVKEMTMQVIYSERPAAVSTSGAVTDVVRRYEAVRYTPQPSNDAQAPKLLEGLNLWIRPRANSSPMMMLLSETRRLSETEYSVNSRQIFLPELASLLPATPRRIGDKWPLSREAVNAMLGEPPVKNSPLIATLSDIRKGAKANEMIAVIAIAGRVTLGPGIENVVKAQVLFTFTPATPDAAAAASSTSAAAKSDVEDVRGAITELRMAKSWVIPVSGGNGRLRKTFTEELVLQRQAMPASSTAPLNVPSPPPIPTDANSWLTYDDPQGRFHFRHPQDLLAPKTALTDTNEVLLLDSQLGAQNSSIVRLIFHPKTDDAKTDKENRDPEYHMNELNTGWTENNRDVLRGPSGWLPEADWSPYKMRVHRIEAAVKPAGPAGKNIDRVYLDYYLVLFAGADTLVLEATTSQSDMRTFRKQVEAVLKTFKLGPSSPNEKSR